MKYWNSPKKQNCQLTISTLKLKSNKREEKGRIRRRHKSINLPFLLFFFPLFFNCRFLLYWPKAWTGRLMSRGQWGTPTSMSSVSFCSWRSTSATPRSCRRTSVASWRNRTTFSPVGVIQMIISNGPHKTKQLS